MSSRPRKQRCSCGSPLDWERGTGNAWLALCRSADCGSITLPVSQRHELKEFIGVSPAPLIAPWTRLFLRAAAINDIAWRSAGVACPGCSSHELFFRMHFWPLEQINQALLCLGCGFVSTLHVTGEGRMSELQGGDDWATPDAAVKALREGIRARAAYQEDQDTGIWDFS